MMQKNDVSFWQKIVAILLSVFVVLSTVAIVLFVNYNKFNKDNENIEEKKDVTQVQDTKPNQNDQGIKPNESKPSGKKIVTFGSYPQKLVDEKSDEYEKLNMEPINWEKAGILDSNSHPYLKYADITLENGKKYRAIKFNENYRKPQNLMQDFNADDFSDGQVYFFAYEDLRWEILDEDTGLAICTTVISSQTGIEIYPWLNGDFCPIAFSNDEKTEIVNQKNAKDEYAVTLLSNDKLEKYKSISSDCKYTKYAYYMGGIDKNLPTTNWWITSSKVSGGNNFLDTNNLDQQNYTTFAGVRPVICIPELAK